MSTSTVRTASGWGRVSAVGVGALLAAASLVPAAAAEAATTTTVHGTVQSGATRLAGVPVGFWSRTGRTITTTTSGPDGAFTLHVPSGIRGFAYAGVRPDLTRAIFKVGGTAFVRGVIGARQGRASYPLYQGHASATAADLAGGHALAFRLQKPGRIEVQGGRYLTGIGGQEGAGIGVSRLNGGLIGEAPADTRTGTAVSQPLVAGTYRITYYPNPRYLRRTVSVTVPAGGTATLRPSLPHGATVHGVLTGPGGAPAVGVPVALATGLPGATDVTDSAGRYSIPALATGDHRLRVGYWPQPDPETAGEMPEDAFKPPTSDDYLPRTVAFPVDAARHDVTENLTLAKAGHVTGTVTGATGPVRVWLEDTAGRILRSGGVTGGRYALGGLTPGVRYRVYAAPTSGGAEDGKYGGTALTATSGTQRKDIAVTRPTLTLKGSIAGGPAAFVVLRPAGTVLPVLDRRFQSASGSRSYAVRGLIPGRYGVTVQPSGDALPPRPASITLTGSPTTVVRDSAVGPKPGAYTVRFVSGAAPIPNVFVTAVDGRGDTAELVTEGSSGRATARGLRAGTYRYVRSSFASSGDGAAPAADGPWWFGAVSRTFAVGAGRTTDDGTIALHVRATL